ncbi:hypothetical protein TNIN_244931 [Trichonephila inaurata madagascariensis]|uniref:Uncharacterized protein n=1 Tax=Trichonephila inaurata madagascariensis TaxID=2747483 RepID=A0A8X6Y8K8_9ARAC|nr:hypothetical protein TNIN_244931 [Trichonephila inaurata madagascariensis]
MLQHCVLDKLDLLKPVDMQTIFWIPTPLLIGRKTLWNIGYSLQKKTSRCSNTQLPMLFLLAQPPRYLTGGRFERGGPTPLLSNVVG